MIIKCNCDIKVEKEQKQMFAADSVSYPSCWDADKLSSWGLADRGFCAFHLFPLLCCCDHFWEFPAGLDFAAGEESPG